MGYMGVIWGYGGYITLYIYIYIYIYIYNMYIHKYVGATVTIMGHMANFNMIWV